MAAQQPGWSSLPSREQTNNDERPVVATTDPSAPPVRKSSKPIRTIRDDDDGDETSGAGQETTPNALLHQIKNGKFKAVKYLSCRDDAVRKQRKDLVKTISVLMKTNDASQWLPPKYLPSQPRHLPDDPKDWSTTLLQLVKKYAQQLQKQKRNVRKASLNKRHAAAETTGVAGLPPAMVQQSVPAPAPASYPSPPGMQAPAPAAASAMPSPAPSPAPLVHHPPPPAPMMQPTAGNDIAAARATQENTLGVQVEQAQAAQTIANPSMINRHSSIASNTSVTSGVTPQQFANEPHSNLSGAQGNRVPSTAAPTEEAEQLRRKVSKLEQVEAQAGIDFTNAARELHHSKEAQRLNPMDFDQAALSQQQVLRFNRDEAKGKWNLARAMLGDGRMDEAKYLRSLEQNDKAQGTGP